MIPTCMRPYVYPCLYPYLYPRPINFCIAQSKVRYSVDAGLVDRTLRGLRLLRAQQILCARFSNGG